MAVVLIVPGLGGSGPHHWQTWWQARESTAERIEQEDWNEPDLERWSARVGEYLQRSPEPAWLVAHSFGCLASVNAGMAEPRRVAGALLVAPADPARFGLAAALPREPLGFPSILVASANDPWMKFARAAHWSRRWGSRLINLGRAGHINAESGYGPWPRGPALLGKLRGLSTPITALS